MGDPGLSSASGRASLKQKLLAYQKDSRKTTQGRQLEHHMFQLVHQMRRKSQCPEIKQKSISLASQWPDIEPEYTSRGTQNAPKIMGTPSYNFF
jgi:hypothetical protein